MQKKKSVWIFNHYAITPNYPGGTRHFELGKIISEHGFDVVIFASSFLHKTFTAVQMERNKKYKLKRYNKLKFIWLKTMPYKSNNWKRIINMFSYCYRAVLISNKLVKKKIIDKPTCIVGSTVHPFAALTASLLSIKYQIPFIFEIRDLWPQTFIDMGTWKKRSIGAILFKLIEKITIKITDKFVILSPETRGYLSRAYSISEKDIFYVPNGVNVKDFKCIENGVRNKYFKLIYFGGIDKVHGLEILFKAMEKLEKKTPYIKSLIYGNGKLKKYYMDKFRLSNISWKGTVEKRKAPAILSSADALFLSTHRVYYGSENKLYEYMAACRPIISAVHAPHNDIVKKIHAGFSVNTNDSNDLADAIYKMYYLSGVDRKKMGLRGLDYVKKFSDWEILSRKIIKIFVELDNK